MADSSPEVRIREIICETFGLGAEEVTLETAFPEDLFEASSYEDLDHLEEAFEAGSSKGVWPPARDLGLTDMGLEQHALASKGIRAIRSPRRPSRNSYSSRPY